LDRDQFREGAVGELGNVATHVPGHVEIEAFWNAPRVTFLGKSGVHEEDYRLVGLAPDASPCSLEDLVQSRMDDRVFESLLGTELV
jgi:hypothetical protein